MCSDLTQVYCYAEAVPTMNAGYNAFADCPQSTATLYVPTASLELYQNTYPWSDFGTIKALEDSSLGVLRQDAAPARVYNLNGLAVGWNDQQAGRVYLRDGKKVVSINN